MPTLIFMGDSITDCGRLTSGGAGYPTGLWGPGYPGLVASRLLADRPAEHWNILNQGISGNRVVDLYARWKRDCLNLKPDILSILVGINDLWHEKTCQDGVEIPRFAQFYRMLLEWTRTTLPEIRLVLMEPFAGLMGDVQAEWLEDVDQRCQIVRQLAREFGAALVPTREILQNALREAPVEYWLVDGVHPAPPFHQRLADAWLQATGLLS
ncbi:MAG: SGNH/GDSL hydrolase family protein [Oligosphaeraceae bacterium]